MRWLLLIGCLAVCYNPQLGTSIFFCHEDDVPACPDGQRSVAGRCYAPNATIPTVDDTDLGADNGGNDLGGTGWSSGDLSMQSGPQDLSSPTAPPDLLMCVPLGGYCPHLDSACCSKWCEYSGPKMNTCVPHP